MLNLLSIVCVVLWVCSHKGELSPFKILFFFLFSIPPNQGFSSLLSLSNLPIATTIADGSDSGTLEKEVEKRTCNQEMRPTNQRQSLMAPYSYTRTVFSKASDVSHS